jgi:hypothetical protein
MDILHGIESKVLALRDTPPAGNVMEMAESCADIELSMERPLHTPPIRPELNAEALLDGGQDIDTAALFDQVMVDRARLAGWIRQALQDKAQVTLAELVERHPLEQGLAELVAWLSLADGNTVFEEEAKASIAWLDEQGFARRATLPRVIYAR